MTGAWPGPELVPATVASRALVVDGPLSQPGDSRRVQTQNGWVCSIFSAWGSVSSISRYGGGGSGDSRAQSWSFAGVTCVRRRLGFHFHRGATSHWRPAPAFETSSLPVHVSTASLFERFLPDLSVWRLRYHAVYTILLCFETY